VTVTTEPSTTVQYLSQFITQHLTDCRYHKTESIKLDPKIVKNSRIMMDDQQQQSNNQMNNSLDLTFQLNNEAVRQALAGQNKQAVALFSKALC
jgi:shikimate kinase